MYISGDNSFLIKAKGASVMETSFVVEIQNCLQSH